MGLNFGAVFAKMEPLLLWNTLLQEFLTLVYVGTYLRNKMDVLH